MGGAELGAFFLSLAVDWSLALFGMLAFMTVIMAFLIVLSIGSSGMQKHLKEWFWGVVVVCLLSGSFQFILRTLQDHLKMGGGATPAG